MSRRKRSKTAPANVAATTTVQPHARAPLGLLLVLLATFIVYHPALHGGMLVDDEGNITPPKLQSVSGLYHIWFSPTVTAQYYPLLHTVFWIEHKLWGDAVLCYHLVTLLWHLTAVTLVYAIVQKLKVRGALLAAAIFALHPVMVESVAWMCEQKNTLSTVFYLSALLFYIEFDTSRRPARYFPAMALFLAALLTKSITVTLPVALLIILWWQRGRLSWARDVRPLVPFFALSIAIGVVTVLVERSYFHGQEAEFTLSLIGRILIAGRALWFYVGKLVWPANLMFTYPRWTIDRAEWWQWIYPAAAIAMTVALWAIRKWSRAPLAGWLFYCGTLFPALGFANVYMFTITFVADHMQYLASLGLIVPVAAAAAKFVDTRQPVVHQAATAVCVLLLATLAVLSFRQSELYGDVVKFYATILETNPNSWLAHNNLGKELYRQQKTGAAIDHYRAALKIKPDFALAHRNLGGVFVDNRRFAEAIDAYQAALKLNPDDALALNGLGNTLIVMGNAREAISHLERTVKVDPEYAEAHNNLGIALGSIGRTAEAIAAFRRALEIDSRLANAHNNWGIALASGGENAAAIEQFKQAVATDPNDANSRHSLAEMLVAMNQAAAAIPHYERAIEIRPDFAAAYIGLANALVSSGRTADAIAAAGRGVTANRAAGREDVAKQIEQWLNGR
jgi:protein O-mannosyl-transferase